MTQGGGGNVVGLFRGGNARKARQGRAFQVRPAIHGLSAADELQYVLVDHVGMGREHAVRKAGVDLQRPVLEKLYAELGWEPPSLGNPQP